MRSRPFIVITSLFLIFSLECSAQLSDSIRIYLHKKPWITGGLGSVQSFFYGYKAPIGYASLGLSYAGRIRVGVGYCKLKVPQFDGNFSENQLPFYTNNYFLNPSGGLDTVNAKLHFQYMMLYMEYVFYKTKHWTFSVPLRFGFGKTNYKYYYAGADHLTDKHFMFIYHPAVSFDYTIFRWLGFNTELGYKFTVSDLKNIRQNFNSPVYSFGFFLYYSEIYKMCFQHSKLVQRL